jgi:hypothetical protein
VITVRNILKGKVTKADRDYTVPANRTRSYRLKKHPASGLSVMVPVKTMKRKVRAAEVVRLNSELL